jgi:hypothetical protein
MVEQGSSVGPQLELPLGSNVRQMEELVNELLQVRSSLREVLRVTATRVDVSDACCVCCNGAERQEEGALFALPG